LFSATDSEASCIPKLVAPDSDISFKNTPLRLFHESKQCLELQGAYSEPLLFNAYKISIFKIELGEYT